MYKYYLHKELGTTMLWMEMKAPKMFYPLQCLFFSSSPRRLPYDKPQPPLPPGRGVPPPPGVTRASNACPKAIVVFDHVPPGNGINSAGQVSLDRSQIVDVIDQTGKDWWKVMDATGRSGFYPAHYLKII